MAKKRKGAAEPVETLTEQLVTQPRYIPWGSRSAYGQGWEDRRAGVGMNNNPYAPDTWKWKAYREGWLSFVESISPVH